MNHRLGWSFGGVVAFEIARQLREVDEQVQGVILIDSPYPVDHDPLPESVIEHIIGTAPRDGVTGAIRQHVLTQFRTNAAMLGAYKPSPSRRTEGLRFCMLRGREELDTEAMCGVRYTWLSDPVKRTNTITAWKSLVRQDFPILDIPGNHFEVLAIENVSGGIS